MPSNLETEALSRLYALVVMGKTKDEAKAFMAWDATTGATWDILVTEVAEMCQNMKPGGYFDIPGEWPDPECPAPMHGPRQE